MDTIERRKSKRIKFLKKKVCDYICFFLFLWGLNESKEKREEAKKEKNTRSGRVSK